MRKILVIVLSIALLTIIVTLFSNKQETSESTDLYEASVVRVEKSASVDGECALIYTHEFTSPLYVGPQVYSKCGNEILERLHSNDKIHFKIHQSLDPAKENLPFIPILELTTDNKVIFSLDEYNAAMTNTLDRIQITKIVACFLFGVVILLLLFWNKCKQLVQVLFSKQ